MLLSIGKFSLLILAALIDLNFIACSTNSGFVTGPGTDVTSAIIIDAELLDSCCKPAQNVIVTMRKNDFLPDVNTNLLGKRIVENNQFIYLDTTDKEGKFAFTRSDSILEGVYCIEGRYENKENCIFIDRIVIDSAFLHSGRWFSIPGDHVKTDATLRPPSTIKGTVEPIHDFDGGFVCVYGLNIYAPIHRDGSFELAKIPSGMHRLHIIMLQNGNEQKCTFEVMTIAGQTTTLGTFYEIYYNGNGNTGGRVPVAKNVYTIGDTIMVPGNSGNLEKTGFTFAGWNTNADGSGVTYQPGDTMVIDTSAIVLNAQWKIKRYLLTVISGGNGEVSESSDSIDHGSEQAITAAAHTGYLFDVWRVDRGKAKIIDSTAPTTTVLLEDGDASVKGFFKVITFQMTFGGTGDENANSVQQTNDGGYIITGSASSFGAGGIDAYLLKMNAAGDTLWTKTFSGTNSNNSDNSLQQSNGESYIIDGSSVIKFDAGGNEISRKQFWSQDVRKTNDGGYIVNGSYLILTNDDGTETWGRAIDGQQQTKDGGYIITGSTSSVGEGIYEIFLIKNIVSGDTIWIKPLDKTNNDYGNSVQQTNDGGYILAGSRLIKTDADGNEIWSKAIFSRDVKQADDGGYIINGSRLIKTDAAGNEIWSKAIGGQDVKQTNDGGYIITGKTYSVSIYPDVDLIKTTADGDTMWRKIFGGTKEDIGSAVQQTNDGGYIITGATFSFGAGHGDVYLIKTTETGDTMWIKTFGGIQRDEGVAVQQTDDGGYIIVGFTYSFGAGGKDVYLIKTTATGETMWTKTFGGAGNDRGNSVQQTSDGGYIITGETLSFGAGNADVFVIKTDVNGLVETMR
jgi:hypothetical protein